MPDLPLKIDVVQPENRSARVLVLNGPLTLGNMFHFQALVRSDESRGTVVNMTAVPYIDSAGIGCLVGAQLFHQRNGRTFALVGLNQRVRDILRITAVDSLFTLFDTVDEAISGQAKSTTA